jgi:hypothetical protein
MIAQYSPVAKLSPRLLQIRQSTEEVATYLSTLLCTRGGCFGYGGATPLVFGAVAIL